MSRQSFSGAAVQTHLTAPFGSTDTSFQVNDVSGWPNTATGPFTVRMDDGTNTAETVLCSSFDSGSKVVTVATNGRNIDQNGPGTSSSTGSAHSTGAADGQVFVCLSAGVIDVHDAFVAAVGTVTPSTIDIEGTGTDGASGKPADALHAHPGPGWRSSVTTTTSPGDSANDGVSDHPARDDHAHAAPALPVNPQFPIGGILIWPATGALPGGLLDCDGSAVSRTGLAALFAIIATTYGSGDGSTTFNLPNLQGKFVQGSGGSGPALAATGGASSQTLTVGQIPQMTPSITVNSGTANTAVTDPGHDHGEPGGEQFAVEVASSSLFAPTSGATPMSFTAFTASAATGITVHDSGHTHTASSSAIGTASPSSVSTVPPYIALRYVIRAS